MYLKKMHNDVPNQFHRDIFKKESIMYSNIGVDNNPDTHNLKIFDSVDSGVHWINKDEGVFSFILIPRMMAINKGKMKKQYNVIKVFNKLQKVLKSCKRSPSKPGYSTSGGDMKIFGLKSMQGNIGISSNSTDTTSNLDTFSCNTMKNHMSTLVHILKWTLDTPLLMGMYNVHVNGAWKGIDVIHYAATATSVDFTSGTHRDFDMLVSMFNANIEMMY